MIDLADRIGAKYEWMSTAQIADSQSEALAASVAQAAKSPYYSAKFKELGIDPAGIRSRDDISRLPFTAKEDLRLSYPDTDAHGRSRAGHPHAHVRGTTGKPTAIFHTRADVDNWAELMARCLAMTGATSKDVFQNMSGYGLFTGGLGLHYGAERLGMWTIPAGRRQHRPPDNAHSRLPRHRHPRHAQLRHARRGTHGRGRRRSEKPRHQDRRARSGAIHRGASAQAPGPLRLQGVQQLRPVRDERAGRRVRVPVPGRYAHLGGQLHSRDHRPETRCSPSRTARSASLS